MTTTELMIGNWVLDTRTNKPLRVNPFMSELEVPTWKPIPITHEILEMNGFKKNYCLPTYKWQNHRNYTITIDLEDKCIVINHGYLRLVYTAFSDYIPVHYLQNYITLCQINKEIIL